MRATIELPDDLRAAVLAAAARKGYRGYSRLIADALRHYLAEQAAAEGGLARLLALRGAWSADEAAETRRAIERARASWRTGTS